MYLKSSQNIGRSHTIFGPAKETPQPNSVHMRATFCGKARHSWDKAARKIPGPRDNFWTENSKIECPNRGPDVQIAVSKSRPKLSKSRKVSVQRGGGITPPPSQQSGAPRTVESSLFLEKIFSRQG